MMRRRVARLTAAAISLLLGLLALEAAFRIIDHQPLTRVRLTVRPEARASAKGTRPDLQYVDRVPLAAAMQRSWYDEEPPTRDRFPLDQQLTTRAAKYADPVTPFFEFNRRYLLQQLCRGRADMLGALDDFFYFEPVNASPYPSYRHLRHVSPPGWFVTNNFGWRGRDIMLHRRDDVVRIAFVGASTTVDAYSVPFSHPELVEHWLNRRAVDVGASYRVEVINAGRTGIDSKSIAAVVETEVAPLDPDYVVFYEGANQFWPGQLLDAQLGRLFPRPAATFRERSALENHSAVIRRLLSAWDRFRGRDGHEPAKPPARVSWPEAVDEHNPNPRDPRLPMDLPQVIRDLDTMRSFATAHGGELVVASFVWLVHEDLQLDLRAHANIYRYLNETLWPMSYAHVRRMADFQNRVFAAYAGQAGARFVDVAGEFPADPDLFDDPIHLNYDGLRLQGWIFAQHLARLIDAGVTSGVLPRRHATAGPAVHPAFASDLRQIVTAAELLRSCS